jgi:hypothetical protein
LEGVEFLELSLLTVEGVCLDLFVLLAITGPRRQDRRQFYRVLQVKQRLQVILHAILELIVIVVEL